MNSIRSMLVAAAVAVVLPNAYAAGNAAKGKEIVQQKACASCHGADFNSPADPTYPRLAGQHPDYLEHALKGYKSAENAMMGRHNAMMQGFATQLSDQDIKDVAAYLSSLSGSLVTAK